MMLNKTSIQRGMFNSLYFRGYEDDEEGDGNRRIYFENPLNVKDIKKKTMLNFDKLDKNGFVRKDLM